MTTDIDTDVWQSFPEYVALTKAAREIPAIPIPLQPGVNETGNALLEQVLAGEKLTGEDLIEKMARAQLGTLPAEAAQNWKVNAIHELRNRLAIFEQQHRDDALQRLNERMSELFARVVPLAAGLSDIASAEEAMHAGDRAVKAWAALSELVGTYRALRAQQADIVASSYDHAPQARIDVARHGIVKESRQYPPLTNEVDGSAEPWVRSTPNGRGSELVSPGRPWPADDDRALLLWLVANDCEPWIPTIPELRAEMAAHRDECAQAAADREHPDRAARRRAAAVAEAKADRRINALLAEADATATMAAADPLYAARMAKL